MNARDVMTKSVFTVRPETSVHDIALLMSQKHVSGLPVVSPDNEVLGIVSESDLLRRVELGTEPKSTLWSSILSRPGDMAAAFSKAHGQTAHDVMSRPVISVSEESDIGEVAATLDKNRIKRVPVVFGGRLVGMIARSDLIRAFAELPARQGEVHLGSGIIHEAIRDALKQEAWLDTSYVNFTVDHGVVTVTGYVESDKHRDALRVLLAEIPGVDRVEETLKIGVPKILWDGTVIRQ